MKDNFCYHPFHGIDIDNDGTLRPCCKFKQQLYPDWKSYNIRDGINNYLSSNQVKRLQQDFAQGKKPESCVRCWKDEEAGFPSKRQLDGDRWGEEISGDGIRFLAIPIGNLCNIKCRICTPRSSSTWIKEHQDLFGEKIKVQGWHKDPKIWDEVMAISQDCLEIHIHGGEPFLHTNTEHNDLIFDLVRTGNANHMRLHYSTNGTVFPDGQLFEHWSNFKSVDIQISLDDVGKRFEYNRNPAKWSEVHTNLLKYLEKAKLHQNLQLSISTVVSAFTIYYLDEIFDCLLGMGLPKPWLGRLHTPEYYRASIFSNDVKEKISQRLLASNYEDVRNAATWLDDDDHNHWKKFLEMVDVHDRYRHENFSSTFPELFDLIFGNVDGKSQ